MMQGMGVPPQGVGPGMEEIDRVLVEQILMLPPEMKLQLLEVISQAAPAGPGMGGPPAMGPPAGPQEQALGQVVGGAARGY